MKTGIELIAQERTKQIEKHGITIESDDMKNSHCQLSEAASLLCITESHLRDNDDILHPDGEEIYISPFGWDESDFIKMMAKTYKERLIIAGALIAAEIDRIQTSEI